MLHSHCWKCRPNERTTARNCVARPAIRLSREIWSIPPLSELSVSYTCLSASSVWGKEISINKKQRKKACAFVFIRPVGNRSFILVHSLFILFIYFLIQQPSVSHCTHEFHFLRSPIRPFSVLFLLFLLCVFDMLTFHFITDTWHLLLAFWIVSFLFGYCISLSFLFSPFLLFCLILRLFSARLFCRMICIALCFIVL